MKVEIADDAFASPDTPALLALFRFGLEDRHRVSVWDDPAPRFEEWKAGLDEWSRLVCDESARNFLRLEAIEPSWLTVRVVGASVPNWSGTQPLLTPGDALDLLQRPYRVLLENARSDGNFLLAMATDPERRFLLLRLDREWLEFESCGGISALAARVRELNGHRQRSLRCSALFDSDAHAPGQPSADSAKARKACGARRGIHHHQLGRRAAENYIPLGALEHWAGRQAEHKKKVRAFARLTAEQQRHYRMKDHFGVKLSQLFGRRGLGDASVWQPGVVSERELHNSEGWAELRPFIEDLIARIR